MHRTHRIDVDHAHLVADAFLAAPRTSTDPVVVAAYAALAEQASRWFALLTGSVTVVYTRCPDPYATGQQISEQIRAERVLELSPAHHERDRRHPLLDSDVGGAYDKVRAVHDIVSHGRLGYGFDRDGEYSAWLAEDRMYVGLARWALATELHGEHSVRWTTGDLADHKATLLPPEIVLASRRLASSTAPNGAADCATVATRREGGTAGCERTATTATATATDGRPRNRNRSGRAGTSSPSAQPSAPASSAAARSPIDAGSPVPA